MVAEINTKNRLNALLKLIMGRFSVGNAPGYWTNDNDPMYGMLEEEKNELTQKQKLLEAKKEKLGIMDSPEDIALLHRLLGNFDKVWAELPFEEKQRAFNILINRIEIEIVSMHWLRLTIDWLDAICPRLDIAYIWKANSSRIGAFTEEEDNIIRQYYYDAPKIELLKLMPKRSWGSIRQEAAGLEVKRKRGLLVSTDITSLRACYRDFCPQSDDTYLFGDYATTLRTINIADEYTSRLDNPLYAIWLLPTNIEGLADVIQGNLAGTPCAAA